MYNSADPKLAQSSVFSSHVCIFYNWDPPKMTPDDGFSPLNSKRPTVRHPGIFKFFLALIEASESAPQQTSGPPPE